MTVNALYSTAAERPLDVKEVYIGWIMDALSCDGNSVAITTVAQPSIEGVILGAIFGLPKVHLHNPLLAYPEQRSHVPPIHRQDLWNQCPTATVDLISGGAVRVDTTLHLEETVDSYVLVDRGLIVEVIAHEKARQLIEFNTVLKNMWIEEDARHA